MNKKGTGLAWETVVSWAIKITAVAIVIFVIFGGPKAMFSKVKEITKDVFGEKIKPSGVSGGSPTIPDEFRQSYDSIVKAFNDAKKSSDSNCFISYTPTASDMKGNRILVEEDISAKGANVVFVNTGNQRISSGDSVIAGIKPCVLAGKGAETFFNYWLLGKNVNIVGFAEGNIEINGEMFKIKEKEYRLNSKVNTIVGKYDNLIYKADNGYACLIPYSGTSCAPFKGDALGDECADIIANKARFCSEQKEEASFDCKKEINGIPYFFKDGEYYCENPGDLGGWFKGDVIYECKKGNVWENKNINSEYLFGGYRCITSDKKSKLPYNTKDACCCKENEANKCIKKNGNFNCASIGFEEKNNCPENIGKRRPAQGG